MIKSLNVAVLSALLLSLFACEGWAQSGGYSDALLAGLKGRTNASRFSVAGIEGRLMNRSALRPGVAGINLRSFLGTGPSTLTQRKKPFSSISRGPSVSPYLALSAPRAAASDYQTIIRPQQRKQRENQRQQAFAIRRLQQLNKMAARAPYSATGDENRAPTGHAAVFQSLGSYQNTGNYFPPPSRPKQR